MISAKAFVEKVQNLEGVVIALWAQENTQVEDYDYLNRAPASMTIASWIDARIRPKVGNIEIRIIDGRHISPNRNQLMNTLRESYNNA